MTGQVVKVMGGQVQLLRGWRPITEATDDKPWTIDIDRRRVDATLFAKSDKGVPPFMPERRRQRERRVTDVMTRSRSRPPISRSTTSSSATSSSGCAPIAKGIFAKLRAERPISFHEEPVPPPEIGRSRRARASGR